MKMMRRKKRKTGEGTFLSVFAPPHFAPSICQAPCGHLTYTLCIFRAPDNSVKATVSSPFYSPRKIIRNTNKQTQ